MTKSRGILTARRHLWTAEKVALLREIYPHTRSSRVAEMLGFTISRVYAKANKLGLRKSTEYLASADACRLRRGDNLGAAYRYPKGHVPANKGLRRPGWHAGRMHEHWFKKGTLPHTSHPDFYVLGALRVNADGYIDMRISFEHGALGWRALHRILWEDAHGPIPKGFVVTFINGDKLDVELANLQLLSLADNARRNIRAYHAMPCELRGVIQTLGRLKKGISNREKQNRGPARPSVRNARGAAG